MKKYTFLALTLVLCGAMLVGCGCMNSNAEMTTAPTTKPTTVPTTAATTEATSAPTTMPETESTALDGETHETAGQDGIVDTEPSGTGTAGQDGNAKSRSSRRIPSMG